MENVKQHQKSEQYVTGKAVSSVKWSALMDIVSRTAQPIIFVILARLLTPEDFGVVATAMIAISFSQMFWDAGLSKALIQSRENPEKAANVVFWTNVVLGLVIYLILFLMAPWLAIFFNSPASGPVLRVLGIQIVLASLSSVQQALFVRELDFKRLFWIRLLTAFFPGFFSIPLAFYGYGVWALVAGSIAGQLLNLYLLWQKSPWRPNFSYDLNLAQKLTRFGIWVLLESFGAWLIIWGDNLIVGRFLGVHDLGVYRTGWMLVTFIFGLALNPFLPVLYPMFSRLQDDPAALRNAFHKANRIIFSLALPMGFGLLVTGSDLANLLFGQKWQGLGFVISVLGLTYTTSWLVSLNTELYRAIGRPDINNRILYIYIFFFISVLFYAARYGLYLFVFLRFLLTFIIGLPIQIYYYTKIVKDSPFYIWQEGKTMICSAVVMIITIICVKWWIFPSLNITNLYCSVVSYTLAGGLSYLLCLLFLDKKFVLETKLYINKAIST